MDRSFFRRDACSGLVPKGPDPRVETRPLEDVPRLLREGADEFNARRFWHAHESWESAWHALRSAGRDEQAAYLRGMILVTAALENAVRGKEDGFKRQLAEGLHTLIGHRDAAPALGILASRAWEDAIVALYLDACRRRDWTWWNEHSWQAPRIQVSPADGA